MEWSHSGHSCRDWCQTKHLSIGDGISFPIRDEDRQVQCPLGWDPDCNIYPVSRVVATSPFPARKSIPRGFQKQLEGFKIFDRESGNLEPSSIFSWSAPALKYINKQMCSFIMQSKMADGRTGIVPEISGRAYITSMSTQILEQVKHSFNCTIIFVIFVMKKRLCCIKWSLFQIFHSYIYF